MGYINKSDYNVEKMVKAPYIWQRVLWRLALIALAMLIALCVSGQEMFSLDSCRRLALANNKLIRIHNETIRSASYQRKAAFAAYLPAIDFTGGYTYNQKDLSIFESDQLLPTKTFNATTGNYEFNLVTNPSTGEPIKTANGQYIPSTVALIPKESMTYNIHHVFFGAVTLTQPIFMGGKIVAMNKITHYAEEIARSQHDSAAEDVIYAVDAAYWQVVSLQAKLKLAKNYVAMLDTLHRNVTAMVQEGVATKADLLTVEVKRNEANVDLTKVDNGVVLSRMSLAQLCGLPLDTSMILENETDNNITPYNFEPAKNSLDDVYTRRQDLQSLYLGEKISEQKKLVAMAEILPNIAIVGTYSFSNPNIFNGFKRQFDGTFSIGATIKIPLWHWGGDFYKYRSAATHVTIMKLQIEEAKEKIALQVRQATFKAQESFKVLDSAKSNLNKAHENLRQAQLGFKEGIMTTDEVMKAQTAWLKACSEKIDAEIDVNLCHVYLSKVLGTLNYSQYLSYDK